MALFVLGAVLAVVAVLAAAFLALSAELYRRLFIPARPSFLDDFGFTPWEFQVNYEDVDLVTADGVAFGAWFFRQSGSPQVIVISPGHKGRRESLLGIAVALWRKGFNVLVYSYRGMPGSDRTVVTMGVREVQELESAIAFARRRVRGARIGLLGYSMGAVVSLLGAAGDPSVEALVLDSPFSDLRRVIRENIRRYTLLPGAPFVMAVALWLRLRHGVRISESSPIAVLSGLESRPVFFIHGGADGITSVQHSRLLHDAYKGPREIWVVQGAPHTGAYFADRQLYLERVAGFFARNLGLKAAGQLRLVEDDDEEVS
ncbi:MAG: alpha/beta hydrolase [Candidatus Nephthysia bennettiae]|uniref:Alpha/beta fold hydrolase n=1 Tax=Candidatus Nephthysia bennettiae TaxID=3127016 RepID=A0A934KA15_9BACT|nr:alpha/beta fold hydrolase [Candidatus Dormibacteraeota bacterium]MBJ7614669.1 alpha/beta fold hydrolase [Candidatus Dormibacteraeota bacterium]PZR86463.1 MAG: alpha/beta hydrolase [Candidatus Dormibacteraeota bacterium]